MTKSMRGSDHGRSGAASHPVSSPARLWLFKLLVPLLAVAVSVAGVELLLRLPIFSPLVDLEPTLYSGPLTYLANQESRHRLGGEIDTVVRINSRGFKDVEYSPTTSSRTAVTLGDSFTEGWGVSLEESWPKRLEVALRGATLVDHIYNAGLNGRNPKNYAEVYRQFFATDASVGLVLIGFYLGNDVVEPSTPAQRAPPEFTLVRQAAFGVSRHSYLYNIVRRRVRYNPRVQSLLTDNHLVPQPTLQLELMNNERNRQRWPYTVQFLTDFVRAVEQDGRRAVVILIPTKEAIDDEYFEAVLRQTRTPRADADRSGLSDFMLSMLTGNRVPTLDLTPHFRERAAAAGAGHLYYRADPHWTPAGHALAADAIMQFVRRENLLP